MYRMFEHDPSHSALTAVEPLPHLHPDDRGPVLETLRSALEHRRSYSIGSWIQVGGVEKHIRGEGSPHRNAHGKLNQSIGVAVDRTGEVLRQRRIEELVRRLDRALDSSRFGVSEWDSTNDVLLWDARMFELDGVRREEYPDAQAAWAATVHPDDRTRVAGILDAAKADLAEVEGERVDLEQILANLTSNGIQYSAPERERPFVRLAETDRRLLLEVSIPVHAGIPCDASRS